MNRRQLRRHGSTIALCVLALGAALFVFVDRGCVTTDEAAQHRGRLFIAWRADELSAVRVRRRTEQYELVAEGPAGEDEARSYELRRAERSFSADQQEVGQLFASLELGRWERPVDAASLNRTELGLDQPILAFELDMGALRYSLRVGGLAASPADGRYAEIEGAGEARQVVVLSKQLVDSLDVPGDQLRAREIIPYPSSRFRKISLLEAGGAARWTLARQDDGEGAAGFLLSAPTHSGTMRPDRRVVSALLVGIAQLEAHSFADLGAADAGTDEPSWSLQIDLEGPEPSAVRVDVLGPCAESDQLRVARSVPRPVGACVSARAVALLDLTAPKLLDRHVVGAAESDIIEIQLSAAERTVEVARKGAGWHMRHPRAGPADGQAVDHWLAALLAAQGDPVAATEADLTAMGLSPPRATARIVSLGARRAEASNRERLERIEVGAEAEGRVFVRRLEDGAVVQLSTGQTDALLPGGTTLRSTVVYDEAAAHLRTLKVSAGKVEQRFARQQDDDEWRLVEPNGKGCRADPAQVAALADKLVKLRALRWVADGPRESHGLAQPRCIIEATLTEGRAPPSDLDGGSVEVDGAKAVDDVPGTGKLRLALGAETRGGYFAQRDDDPAVFVVPKAFADLASQWLLDRSSLMVSTKTVEQVTLSVPGSGTPLVVAQRDGRWTVPGGPGDGASLALAVRDLLRDMVAEGVVTVGPAPASEGLGQPVLSVQIEHGPRAEGPRTIELRVGTGDVWRNTSVVHVRRDDIDATFVVAQARVQPLRDLL